jgi:hypothetical protein
MKMRATAALAAGALAIGMGLGFGVGQAQVNQPHMRNAMGDLQAAKSELQMAAGDKGGHRVNALDLVNQAIGEVGAGIAYAY